MEMASVILCNGDFPRKEYPLWLLRIADRIVCCDASGTVAKLEKMGLEPSLIVGDMDSMSPAAQKKWAGRIVRIDGQDDNDLAKAMRVLLERWPGETEIHILGATGRSEAHSLGNLGWLMEWEMRHGFQARGVNVDMVSDYNTAFAVSGDISLEVGQGRKISFFTSDSTLRLHSEGLHWPLDGVALDAWWKASLNRADSDAVALKFSHRAPLLIILD